MHKIILGAHMSIAGGLEKTILNGQSIGCTTIQIFTKNNRQWATRHLQQEEIDIFKETKMHSTVQIVVAHAGYLINIGSYNPGVEQQSINSLIHELHRCSLLDIPYLVLHPGSRGNATIDECITKVINNINLVLKESDDTMILLENMSGQGSAIGATFEHMQQIFDGVQDKKRIGICFDTCHAWV